MRCRLCWVFTINSLLLLMVLLLSGCSGTTWQLERGKRLQSEGKPAAALDVLQSWLVHSTRADSRQQSSAWFAIGECLKALNRPGEALTAYSQAIEFDPANSLARLRLGELYLLSGSVSLAREEAHKAIQRSGVSADALELLGTADAADDEIPAATDALRRALKLDPARTRVSLLLADLLSRSGNEQQAREVLWAAALHEPHTATPYLALGRLAEAHASFDEAEYAYRKAVETENTPETNLRLAQFFERVLKMNEAQKVLQAMDTAHPELPPSLADFQLLAGRPMEAAGEYSTRLSAKQGTAEAKANRARLIARMIEAEIQAGEHNEQGSISLDNARELMARYGGELDEATRRLLLAELEIAGGDPTVAASELSRAAEAAAASPAFHYLAGQLRRRQNDESGAMAEWETALELNPQFAPARMALAAKLLSSGDAIAAEHYIVAVVRQEPANLEALVIYGRVLLKRGSFDGARAIANRIEALGQTVMPNSAREAGSASQAVLASILRGDIAMAQHDPGAALLEYERAMILDPRSDEAMRGLMRAYGKGSITRPMLLRMEEAAAGDPGLARLMELAGRLFARNGWNADAVRCLRRAAAMEASRSSASAAVTRLLANEGRLNAAAESAAKVRGIANLIAALDAERRDDLAEAARNYEAALRSGDSSGVAANNLAWIYARQYRELDRALALAVHARELAPENPAVLDTVGVVRLARREYTAAISALELAQTLAEGGRPNGAFPGRRRRRSADSDLLGEIKRHLAEAYLRVGEPERAALLASRKEF